MGIIPEFKVSTGNRGTLTLEESAGKALEQIQKKDYAVRLRSRGLEDELIYSYGIAFRGKEVCIKGNAPARERK